MGKYQSKRPTTDTSHCSLCGKQIFQTESGCVIGATGNLVCSDCLNTSKTVLNHLETKKEDADQKPVILTPQEILNQLNRSIIGQATAKKAVAIALWKQQLRAAGDLAVPCSSLLLYGPSGCGKTALVREAANIVGLPFIDFDATTLSETGYRGRDADDLVKDLASKFSDHPKLSCGVVFLDEFDKLAARGSDSRVAYNRATQHALLKLVEGKDIPLDSGSISTKSLLFIFGGAFTGLQKASRLVKQTNPIGFLKPSLPEPVETVTPIPTTETFISYGMEAELLGRVGQYISLEALTAADLKQILLKSDLSCYRQYQKFFASHGVTLEFSEKRLDELVHAALRRGTGARGLNSLFEETVTPLLFKLAAGTLTDYILLEKESDRHAG